MPRKPWEIPISYNDWSPDPGPVAPSPVTPKPPESEIQSGFSDEEDDEDSFGLADEDERGPTVNRSNDTTPLDYTRRGDPDEEFGVDDEEE